MLPRLLSLTLCFALLAACSGDTEPAGSPSPAGNVLEGTTTAPLSDATTVATTPPADDQFIRIGDRSWTRTLPASDGECLLEESASGQPETVFVSGTLDQNPAITFTIRLNADGTVDANVSGSDFSWTSGSRTPPANDVQLEVDVAAGTVAGGGTFLDVLFGTTAQGAFSFRCTR
ncbi:MAG: hypothetical protein R3C39_10785 [Dehalococcoidia bacterium]